MKTDIKKITEGEESIIIRYYESNTTVEKIIGILNNDDCKIWGKSDGETVSMDMGDILYVESVDDRVFAYSRDKVIKIDGSLLSFINRVNDEAFFRCSKAMIINVNRVASLKSLSSNRIDATMENGEHIIISRRYAAEFRRFLKGDR